MTRFLLFLSEFSHISRVFFNVVHIYGEIIVIWLQFEEKTYKCIVSRAGDRIPGPHKSHGTGAPRAIDCRMHRNSILLGLRPPHKAQLLKLYPRGA